MGEISKTVGEFGEQAAYRLLDRIGWTNGQRGISIPCNDSSRHTNRQTHGVDYLKLYSCPLVQQRLVNAVVSVKATKDAYDKYPNSKFKTHLKELSDICHCYRRSNEKADALQPFNNDPIEQETVVGVLIWLSNEEGEKERDLLGETSTALIESPNDLSFDAAYFVDTRKAEFLWEILNHADENYAGWEFLYIETGLNYREDIKVKSGSLLPVEYINAGVIPLKYSQGDGENLILYTIERFHEEDLKKLVGLANKLSSGFAGSIDIFFPDFNSLSHTNEMKRAIEYFQDENISKKVSVHSFKTKLIK